MRRWPTIECSLTGPPLLAVHIRWMIRRDMREVLSIEHQAFDQPWYEEDFVLCLQQRNCIGMVAEASETVVGFMVYELHKHSLRLLNLAVHDAFRRRRVGAQLINKLVGKLSPDRRRSVVTEIRETNLAGQLFFRAQGFRAVSVLHRHFDNDEDAYVMRRRFTEPD